MENSFSLQSIHPNTEPQGYQPDQGSSLYQGDKYKTLSKVIARIRESLDIDTIFKITVTEVRQLLNSDRVGVFRFYPNFGWEGEFIYEDVGAEWSSALTAKLRDHCFAKEFARLYQQGRINVIADIYQANISDCHIQILERFQVRAKIAVPLMKGQDLWGLLCIHQCSEPRQWQASEVEFVQLIAEHLGVALQQADYLEQVKIQSAQLAQATARAKVAEWQKIIAITVEKIRQFLDVKSIFDASTAELRQLLNADRVAIYRFHPDWSGEFVFESVAEGWTSLMDEQLHSPELGKNVSNCTVKDLAESPLVDTYLQVTEGGRFTRGEVYRICNDIYSADFSACYIKVLESYQAKAYVIIAIYHGQKLWGLLAVYQNNSSRDWQEDEVYLLTQVGTQLGIALQQAEFSQQLQNQAAELTKAAKRQRALANTVEKIRQSLDIDTIFKATTQEVRRLLKVERVSIYRFNPDWSGKFVADSIVDGWTPIPKPQPAIEQVLFQGTSADKYARYEIFVPISQGEKLWGLLVAYQNSQARYWQDEEINLLAQVGVQLGVAIQQAELLEQTQRQKEELKQTLTELQQTQTQLIQSEKMAGLGQVVAGVAHEINNPINFIYGNITHVSEYTENLLKLLHIYQQNYPNPNAEVKQQAAEIDLDFIAQDLPKILNSMNVGAERISKLVLSLRSFARLDEADMKPVNIHEGIDSTVMILQHRLKPQTDSINIELVKQYCELPQVDCYAAQMNQVFMNILSNAIDALEDAVKVKKTIEHPQICIYTEVIDENLIQIRIVDNGCGIPDHMRSRIFDPFFTTKEPGKGTGVGLYITYQIVVEKHGGQIQCFSKPGKGSEFLIQIPIKRAVS